MVTQAVFDTDLDCRKGKVEATDTNIDVDEDLLQLR